MKKTACIVFILSLWTTLAAASDAPSIDEITDALTLKRGISGTVNLPNITFHLKFQLNSARILPVSITPLDNLCHAIQMSELKAFILLIEGHTCDLGTEAYNMNLSQKRAGAIKTYLTAKCGLPPKQFQIKAFGETQPVTPNTSEQARCQNRRVVIRNTLKNFSSAEQGGNATADYVQMLYKRNNRVNVLKNGDVLTAKDGYAIEFKFINRLYIYICQIDSTGKLSRIFPNPKYALADIPIKGSTFYRVPKHNNWFNLDNTIGQESVILIAGRKPLKDIENRFRKVYHSVDSTRGLAAIAIEPEQSVAGTQNKNETEPEDIFLWRRDFIHK